MEAVCSDVLSHQELFFYIDDVVEVQKHSSDKLLPASINSSAPSRTQDMSTSVTLRRDSNKRLTEASGEKKKSAGTRL